jgi:TrmH family RNA methyltransferase
VQIVASRRHPLVETCRRLRRHREAGDPRVLLDGIHLVAEALESGRTIVAAAISSQLAGRDADTRAIGRRLDACGVHVVEVPDALMTAMSPVRSPSGIVAIAERPADSLDRVFGLAAGAGGRKAARDAGGGTPLVLIAVGVQDPGNLGALIRSAHAGGATGVAATGPGADPFGWKALRGSMGSGLALPVAVEPDTGLVVGTARERQVRLLAAAPRGGDEYFEVDLTGPTAVLLGSEGGGLAREVERAADARIRIPMRPPVDSLNVAVSAGLIVYEALRQRRQRGGRSSSGDR